MKHLLPILTFTCGLAAIVITATAADETNTASLAIRADQPGAVISKEIYGQFSEHLGHCIYGGVWVGEDSSIPNTRGIRNDVVAALKKLKVPVLRWPGGCFADEYHWKDGIGPRDKRPSMINTHWGGVVENNAFGTHEFMDFCEQIGAEPYVSGNLGSGSVQEMMEWVEYMTSDAQSPMANLRRANGRQEPWKLKYFGVGNESWGCGGNMTPDFYSDQFRRYNTFVKNYGGNRLYRIACGANGDDLNWTETVMKDVGHRMNGLSLHYYTLPSGNWSRKGSATEFDKSAWFATLRRAEEMDRIVARHSAAMDQTDPQKRIGLIVDEWGAWYDVEPGTNPGFLYQQNTLRDALVAAVTLNIFHHHADRVKMANIAQLANVLQAMVLTDNEKMTVTPTYHVFEMFNVNQDATSLRTDLIAPDCGLGNDEIPAISASASRDSAGKIHVNLANADVDRAIQISCDISGMTPKSVSGRVLTASEMNAHNTFDAPNTVYPRPFSGAKLGNGKLTVEMPPKSVVVLELE